MGRGKVEGFPIAGCPPNPAERERLEAASVEMLGSEDLSKKEARLSGIWDGVWVRVACGV